MPSSRTQNDHVHADDNQIYGYQSAVRGAIGRAPVFTRAEPVAEVADSGSLGVELHVTPRTTLACYACARSLRRVYLWGVAVHPVHSGDGLLRWCLEVLDQDSPRRFQELLGTFLVIVDDPQRRAVTFVSDVLGVRPLFIRTGGYPAVFGSNVWALAEAGLSNGKLDYDAISSWIYYKYNCTDGSVFAGFKRMPAGSVVTIDPDGARESRYATFTSAQRHVDQLSAADDIHEIVSDAARRLLAISDRRVCSLSGGFDSRYLLALARQFGRGETHTVLIANSQAEAKAGLAVAERLGVEVTTVPVTASLWDLYPDPFHFSADGFAITKQPIYVAAATRPGWPTMSGFAGDPLIRGSHSTCFGKYEDETTEDLAHVLRRYHHSFRTDLFSSAVEQRMQERALQIMRSAVAAGSANRKVFAWADLYYRQRCYISNIFLQHLHLGEALMPFLSYELLAYFMDHQSRCFTWDVYQSIFDRHLPVIASVPHASRMDPGASLAPPRASRNLPRYIRELLAALTNSDNLRVFPRRKVIPRLLSGLVRPYGMEYLVFTLYGLHMLEQRLQACGMHVDWEQL